MIKTSTDKIKLFEALNKSNTKISVIYDCGSRDALDGIELYQFLNASELHIFECNPPSAIVCRKNLEIYLGKENENITWFLNEIAISDQNGEIDFRPIDVEKTVTIHENGNPGASSIFEASGNYKNETYVQNLIRVPSVTIDYYSKNKKKPDLLWMDLQGAELLALKGATNVLNHIKFIHVEVGFREMYKGQCLFWELNTYLNSINFKLYSLDIGRWPNFLTIYKLFNTGPWVGNAIYFNSNKV